MEKLGTLPSQAIRELIDEKRIIEGDKTKIQPSSLDLTVGDKIWRLPSIFMPLESEKIEDVLQSVGAAEYNFDYPLEVNVPYIIKLKEELDLPDDVYAYANPKSSSGRCDLRVTMLADCMPRFDSIGKKGYKGSLWVIVEPKSFRVKLTPGDTLLQLRLFYSDTRFGHRESEKFLIEHKPFYIGDTQLKPDGISISDRDGGYILTIALEDELIGWRCESSGKVLDFSKKAEYDPEEFFSPIYKPKSGSLRIRGGDFYILYMRERVVVPPTHALEMAPVDTRNGEYRSHYAGFIDPGWGYSKDGSVKGVPLVLELRPFEDDIILRSGQPICKVIYEKMAEYPDIVYGESIGSNYFNQSGARLSKHFKNNV